MASTLIKLNAQFVPPADQHKRTMTTVSGEINSVVRYMAKMDKKLTDVYNGIDAIHATSIQLKSELTKQFPLSTVAEVADFPRKGSMDALTSVLTGVVYKSERKYPSDLLRSIFTCKLLMNDLTWPSPQ